jgi:hypothetical protein
MIQKWFLQPLFVYAIAIDDPDYIPIRSGPLPNDTATRSRRGESFIWSIRCREKVSGSSSVLVVSALRPLDRGLIRLG